MQKLKKVFSPGNDKDDEIMYGTPRKSSDKDNSRSSTGGPSDSGSAANQSPVSPTQSKDHGSSRQTVDPSNDKYEEKHYESPTTSAEPQSSKAAEDREAALASRMGEAKEDRSVKRQVLDPSDNKRDETGYGATAFTSKDAQDTRDPTGDKHDETGYGAAALTSKNAQDTRNTSSRPNELGSVPPSNDKYVSTTSAAPGTAITTDTRTSPPETDSRMSMKSGVVGSADQRTNDRALGSDGITSQSSSEGVQSDSSDRFNRNAALAGAGAAAGAGGVYAATRERRKSRTSGDQDIENATYTDRSFPLRGGTNSQLEEKRPTSSVYSNQAAGPSSTSAYIDPATSSADQKDAGGLGYGSGSAAVAGAGAGAVGGMTAKEKLADHSRHSHDFHGDPCLEGPNSPADKTVPYVPGPHKTLAANLEDPHVPGEFPTEDGTDPHGKIGTSGAPRGSPQQPTLLSSAQPYLGSSSTYPMQTSPPEKSSEDHHYGRNAALAGGVGAAGLGTYAATRDRSGPGEQTSSRDAVSPAQQPQTSSAAYSQTPQQVAGDPVTGAREPEKEHHYGRDAALVGGTGAAGVAAATAYQRSKDRDAAVPSTQNTTSHDSTLGAHPETQKRDVTDSTPSKDEKEHHYGRNAALAGGAGAAGVGAYQYSKGHGDKDLSPKASDPYDSYKEAADPTVKPDTSSHVANMNTHPTSSKQAGANTTQQQPYTSASGKADPYTTQQQQQQQTSPPKEDHHYGRNAALAGGAGAAGVAGYSALQSDRGDTGPASKTIGPHESNVANILDPRVRPEPEKMKDHTTAGPWQSDTLNKLDPKVQSDPNKADVKAHGYASGVAPQSAYQQQGQNQAAATGEEGKDHHYGRNAALAGGAVGAGAAGYGASQAYDQQQSEGLSAKEQEKLAKEQEKQAKHDAKERSKEADKQAKHDADEAKKAQKKEQEKQAKEQEKAEKQHAKEMEKAEKERAKEAEKAEKERAKEQEKLEKQRSKEQEKLEKERSKEQEKLEKERSKESDSAPAFVKDKEDEDSQLAAAREEEAERKHNEHNKLHKTPPEEREKKGGILHRIFHHKAHDREGVESGERQSGSFEQDADESRNARNAAALEGGDGVGELREGEGLAQKGASRDSGVVTEKSTGLPMNVGKYGSGAGGTDGGEHIHGYQAEAR